MHDDSRRFEKSATRRWLGKGRALELEKQFGEPGSAGAQLIDTWVWPKSDKPVISSAEFELMKDGVIVVNTARGGIVDEKALIAAIQARKVGAAGLDVFEQEPPEENNVLKQLDQVILSPHIAGVTEGASERMALGSAQNIIDFFEDRIDTSLVVNLREIRPGVSA